MRARAGTTTESGFALFYALLVVLIVGGIIAVTLASATGEIRQSAFELDFEDTVHVAEAGVEAKLQQLSIDADANDGVPGPSVGQSVNEWALDQATEQPTPGNYTLPAIDIGEGEVVALRPTGGGAEYVYGVGFTPNRDAFVNGVDEAYARVVRAQVGFTPTLVAADDAVLVGGNMTISSNSWQVTGTNGSLHANGAASINNNNTTGGITYSGSCTATCGGGSGITGPVKEKSIPLLEIEDPWGTDEAVAITATGRWFDYCGSQWYRRLPANTVPCTGDVVATPTGWNGLTFDGKNVANPDAVYWIDAPGAVNVSKVTGQMTVIARGDINIGPSANVGPMTPKYKGLLLFTEGNADIGGNAESASTNDPGVVYVRGSLTLRGTMSSTGIAYIAKDADVVGSFYAGGGNGGIHYDGGALSDLGGDGTPLVLRWEELRD